MPSSTNRGNASTLGGLIEETLNLILNDEPEDLEPSDERQDRVRSRFRSTSLGLDDAPRKENRYHEEVRDAREVPSIFDILDNNKRTLRMGYEGHEYILPSTRRHISRPRSIDHTEFANASTIATKGTEPILSKEEEMRNRFMSKDHEGNEEATARQMSFTCKKVGSSIKRESSRGRSRSRNESRNERNARSRSKSSKKSRSYTNPGRQSVRRDDYPIDDFPRKASFSRSIRCSRPVREPELEDHYHSNKHYRSRYSYDHNISRDEALRDYRRRVRSTRHDEPQFEEYYRAIRYIQRSRSIPRRRNINNDDDYKVPQESSRYGFRESSHHSSRGSPHKDEFWSPEKSKNCIGLRQRY